MKVCKKWGVRIGCDLNLRQVILGLVEGAQTEDRKTNEKAIAVFQMKRSKAIK